MFDLGFRMYDLGCLVLCCLQLLAQNKATMGELDLKIIHTQKISKICYNIIGKWDITSVKGNAGGYFTLLWKKLNGAWVIMQDHTS